MVKIKPKVVIDNLAKAQLKEAYTYIKLDSPKNAEIVKAKILASPHFAPFVLSNSCLSQIFENRLTGNAHIHLPGR